jgi:DNA-binding response OmpR family regulator
MCAVLLITGRPDLTALAPDLERAGLAASAVTPERFQADGASLADIAVVDLRDMGADRASLLLASLADAGIAALAAVDEARVAAVPASDKVDDFVVMPASPAELARRVERAAWRRHGIDAENQVQCGALSIDLANYRVTVDTEPIVLTFKEYELLRFLVLNAGRVFTREQLLNRVWGYDYFGGARTVDVHIRRIRSKVEIHGHTFIETVRNVGYRLVAEARKPQVEL